jgi:hypothetical protein
MIAVETGTNLANVHAIEMNFDLILEAYRKTLVGKEFVYKSKYGSTTFGTVKRVIVAYQCSMDAESGRRLKVAIGNNSRKVQLEPSDHQPIQVERRWHGKSPGITIISTNGISYDLKEDEIYFIDGENTETTE